MVRSRPHVPPALLPTNPRSTSHFSEEECMLTEFCSPGRAPKVSYVDIFRDHADPHRFYLIPDRPRIANDEKTGTPLFDFTLFSRNIDIAYASAPAGQP